MEQDTVQQSPTPPSVHRTDWVVVATFKVDGATRLVTSPVMGAMATEALVHEWITYWRRYLQCYMILPPVDYADW